VTKDLKNRKNAIKFKTQTVHLWLKKYFSIYCTIKAHLPAGRQVEKLKIVGATPLKPNQGTNVCQQKNKPFMQ
jgi:hypothetical protein